MAIQFKVGKVPFRCDSAKEAAELFLALQNKGFQPICDVNGSDQSSVSSGDQKKKHDFAAFWRSADPNGQQMLRAVAKAAPQPVIAEALVRELNLKDINAVAWTRRKLNITAKKNGMKLQRLISLEKVDVDGKPKTAYRATDRLTESISKLQN